MVTKKKTKFFKSLRFRILVILLILGIVPSAIVTQLMISNYEKQAIEVKVSEVSTQCAILCNQIIKENYLNDSSSQSVNSKLELLSNVYGGRMVIVDRDLKVVADTYHVDEGRTLISPKVVKCFKNGEVTNYRRYGQMLEMAIPGTIMFLIYGFVVGMTAGFTVLTAQKFGAGDMEGMRKTVVGAGVLSFVIGTILTILFMVFMKPLLILMNTPSDIFADSYTYIMIVSGGILAQMLYNLLSSILRALGNSKLPLYFLIISALLNIVLDLVFIIGFQMGAKGAAVATVIAQGTSGVLCLLYIIAKVPVLHIKRDDLQVGGTIYSNQLRIGIPMALQYSITAIGTMMVQSSLNILGSTLVAAFTAAGKIEQVVTQAYGAMGTTMATYGAQNMGAGSVKRIREGFKACTIVGVVYSIVAATFIMTVGKFMTYLFVSEDVKVIMSSVDIYLKCIGIFFIPLAVVNIYRNGIQGLGYGLLPMMAGVAELTGRGIVAVIAGKMRSYPGVCLAGPAAWVLAGGLLLVMYFYIMNVHMKKVFGTNGKD